MKKGGTLSALVAAVLVAAATGCGGGGSSADAAPPDAPPVPDANPGSIPGTGAAAPWTMVSCDGDPVADAGPTVDAGPAADAGPPAGTGASCCDPTGFCDYMLKCIQGPAPSTDGVCRPVCEVGQPGQCQFGGVCADFGGQGVCIPAGGVGDACDPELCEEGTVCVGTSADDATCKQKCVNQDDCTMGGTCTALEGASTKACL